jgi:ribonuclease G
MLELIINKDFTKKTIMLIENGFLIEKHEENENQKRIEGNIYAGFIQNVLQGMQAAFVDIGEERNTFIRLKDLLPKIDEKEISKINTQESNIKNIAKQGMKVLIQVKRDGSAKKGARVSTHINIPRKIRCIYA